MNIFFLWAFGILTLVNGYFVVNDLVQGEWGWDTSGSAFLTVLMVVMFIWSWRDYEKEKYGE